MDTDSVGFCASTSIELLQKAVVFQFSAAAHRSVSIKVGTPKQ